MVYAGNTLPGEAGFVFEGPNGNVGCLYAGTHLDKFYYYASLVDNVCILQATNWHADSEIGFTVEARLKVINDTGVPLSLSGMGIFAGSDTNEALLLISEDWIKEVRSGEVVYINATDVFHTYRITLREGTYVIYVDGIKQLEGAATLSPDGNNLLFGDGTYGAGGESLWDYVAYTTSGSFSPAELDSPAEDEDDELSNLRLLDFSITDNGNRTRMLVTKDSQIMLSADLKNEDKKKQ